MSTSNGHRHRLRRLEDQRAPPADPEEEARERWRTAWNEAAKDIIGTMAPVHVAGMAEDQEAHAHPSPQRPWGRLRREVQSRIAEKVGHSAGDAPRYPDSPLALPPAVCEAILDGPPNLRSTGLRCGACGYRLPVAGELVGVERDGDGWHYRDSREPSAEPALPDVAVAERVRWREIILFSACPLCGGSDLVTTVNDRAPQKVWA